MLLGELLEGKVLLTPSKKALVSNGRSYTYTQMDQRVNKLANRLLAEGIGNGARVGIACKNCSEYIELIFACAKIGAISTHFNWRASMGDMEFLINDSDSGIVFINHDFMEESALYHLKDVCSARFITIGGETPLLEEYEAFVQSSSSAKPTSPLPIHRDDVTMLRYTSGTTGQPKGVLLTHRSVISHALTNLIDSFWTEQDVFLQVLPLFHAAGTGALNSIFVGGTLIIISGYHPEEICQLIQQEKATIIGFVPNLVEHFIRTDFIKQYDISSLTKLTYGAAPMPVTVLKQAMEILSCEFIQYFGMTETGPIISVLRIRDHQNLTTPEAVRRLESVGQPATGAVIRIVDDKGNPASVGVPGEILAKAPGTMDGYHNRPTLSDQVFVDGWYVTNDIGYLDDDGYLFLVERKHDMIISGGENVYPSEVENCIRQMVSDVSDCFVFPRKCSRWGERICGVVVRKEDSSITEEDVITHCFKTLARYKIPKTIIFAEELLYSATGKLMRKELKEKYSG